MTLSPIEQRIRSGFPAIRFFQSNMPLPISNWLLKLGMRSVRLDAGMRRETVSAAGVPCDWLIPQDSPSDRVLLYLHGGGFVLGQTPLHMHMVAYIAQKTGLRSLLVDYRLAPGSPFPAALDDCTAAYRWLLEQGISAHNIVIAGDSAGGNLTITTLMKLRDSGDLLPAAAACLSPVIDLTGKHDSPTTYQDPLLPARAVQLYRRSYVGANDARLPLISPAFGDWRGLPPLLVHVGEDELLREDALRLADLGRAAGLNVRLEIYPRMWHVWQLNLQLPQALQSLDEISAFLKAALEPVPVHKKV